MVFLSLQGLIMTVSKPCYFGNLLLGIVGVDVNLAYILEDVTYYQDSLGSYTFLIDNKGNLDSDHLPQSHWAPEPPIPNPQVSEQSLSNEW